MCFNQAEHELKEKKKRDVAFVIFYHEHFYCISVKYNVCMHVSVLVLMLLRPWQRLKKREEKIYKKKRKNKNQAHRRYYVEIPLLLIC